MFQNRTEAGKLLAVKLANLKDLKNPVCLAIPRGGVLVGKEIASALRCPLGVLITKKIGAPGNEELAVGAMGPEGTVVWNEELLQNLGLSPEKMAERVEELRREIERREKSYKTNKSNKTNWEEKTVILTDDGIATGATVEAALRYISLRVQGFKGLKTKVILAVPVIAADTLERLKPLADEIIYLAAPENFLAVGQFYQEFPQVSDTEVVRALREVGEMREDL